MATLPAVLVRVSASIQGRSRHRDGQPVSIVQHQGITVHIDRHVGTVLEGMGPDGEPYRVNQLVDYGFLPDVMGDDGEFYDCYLGTSTTADNAYVIQQMHADTGAYDEQKAMLGFTSAAEAEKCYRDHTHPSMFGGISEMPLDEFKARLGEYSAKEGSFDALKERSAEALHGPSSGPRSDPCPTTEDKMKVTNENVRADAGAGGEGRARISGGEPAGSCGHDEAPDGMYVRQAVVRAVRPENREVDLIASTEAIDSHRSILRSNWDLKRFMANPVLLWMHGRQNDLPAVGTVRDMKVEAKVLGGTAVFDDTTEFDKVVFQKYEKKVLRGFSVGFCPRKILIEEINGEEILIFDDNELLEMSCANVPSNAEALARAQTALMDRARLVAHAARVAIARGAIPYQAYPPAETETWDGTAAEKRVRAWATKDDGTIDWGRYGSAFGWVDPEKRELFGGYKLLHHDVRDGRLVTDRAGVMAAGNVLSGGRGGVNIPDADMAPTRSHIAKHYRQFDLIPPWENENANKAARRRGHGDIMTIKTTEAAADVRATDDGGMACRPTCPNCAEVFELGLRSIPQDPRVQQELTETRTKLGAAEARAASLETMVTEMTRQLVEADMGGAKRDLDALSGHKVFPAEIEHELELARSWLSDRNLDGTSGKTVGQTRWEAHLSVIRSRPDIGVITAGAALPADPAPAKSAPAVRVENGKKVTEGGGELAALITAQA